MSKSWEHGIVAEARKRVKQRFGETALRFLGEDMRMALVRSEILAAIAAADGIDGGNHLDGDSARRFAAMAALGIRNADPLEPMEG